MGAAGKRFQNVARVIGGTRLAENLPFGDDNRVGGNYVGRPNTARSHQLGLRARQT